MAEYSSDSDSMEEIEDEPSASAIVSREVTQNSYFQSKVQSMIDESPVIEQIEIPEQSSDSSRPGLDIAIPVLNKNNADSNTYDLDRLLDPKLQNFSNQPAAYKTNFIKENIKNAGAFQAIDVIPSDFANTPATEPEKKRSVANFKKRNEAYANKRQENKEAIKDAVLGGEKQACSFAPKVNKGLANRSKETFLKQQQEFLDKKKEKIQKIKEEKERMEAAQLEASHKPELCSRSTKLASKQQQSKPRFEQLYDRRKAKGQEQSPDPQTHSFKPQIISKPKKRTEKVQNLLYSDAMRRMQNKPTPTESKAPPVPTSKVNQQSEILLVNKLIADFAAAWNDADYADSGFINYMSLIRVMGGLRFIRNDPSQASFDEERRLCLSLWDKLDGDNNGVCRDELLQVCFGIQNLYVAGLELEEDTIQLPEDSAPLTKEGVAQVFKTFKLLGENRSRNIKEKAFTSPEKFSFAPNKKSPRAVPSPTCQANFTEYLLNQKHKIEAKKEEVKQRLDKQEKKEQGVTFKPKVNRAGKFKAPENYQPKQTSLANKYKDATQTEGKRIDALYKLAQTKAATMKEQAEKLKKEAELKENSECTFAPNLTNSKTTPKSGGNVIKGVAKTISRITSGRKIKEEAKKITERSELGKSTTAQPVMQFGLIGTGKVSVSTSGPPVQAKKKPRQEAEPPPPQDHEAAPPVPSHIAQIRNEIRKNLNRPQFMEKENQFANLKDAFLEVTKKQDPNVEEDDEVTSEPVNVQQLLSNSDPVYFRANPIFVQDTNKSKFMYNRLQLLDKIRQSDLSMKNEFGEVQIWQQVDPIVLNPMNQTDERITEEHNMLIIFCERPGYWPSLKTIVDNHENINYRIIITSNPEMAKFAKQINAILICDLPSDSLVSYVNFNSTMDKQLDELFVGKVSVGDERLCEFARQKGKPRRGRGMQLAKEVNRPDLFLPLEHKVLYNVLKSCGMILRPEHTICIPKTVNFNHKNPNIPANAQEALQIDFFARLQRNKQEKTKVLSTMNFLDTAKTRDLMVVRLTKVEEDEADVSGIVTFLRNVFAQGERGEESRLLEAVNKYTFDVRQTSTELLIYVSGPIFGTDDITDGNSEFTPYRRFLNGLAEPTELSGTMKVSQGLTNLLPYVQGVFPSQLLSALIDMQVNITYNQSILNLIDMASDLVPLLKTLPSILENPESLSMHHETLLNWILQPTNVSIIQEAGVDRFVQKFGSLCGNVLDFKQIKCDMFIGNYVCEFKLNDKKLTQLSGLNLSIHK